jgi:transposase InsO family protein
VQTLGAHFDAAQWLAACLAKHGLIGSMGRKGNRWDNAVMERLHLESEDASERGRQTTLTTVKPQTILLTELLALTTAPVCTQNWATSHPTLSGVNRHQKNLLNCPKLLDHYSMLLPLS